MKRSLAWIGWGGLIISLGCGGGDSGEVYTATIVRTEFGIPHVTAEDWGSLGFGTGYAYAQDNLCVLMQEIVHANGESLRWFGEEDGSLADDLIYRFYATDEFIEDEFLAASSDDLIRLARGYAAGFNRYLEETGVDNLPEGVEGCRGEPWVRPITEVDLVKVYRKLILRAGVGATAPLILAAEAPTQSLAVLEPVQSSPFNLDALGLPPPTEMGSNAYAIGSNASKNGRGVLLSNTHFPWFGPLRWYIQHLTIPGELNVMGAALQGLPIVNVGFNENIAWSHTVSIGQRFTFYDLTLVDGNPMQYIYDGETRDIETHDVTIQVMLEDGTVEDRIEQIYTSHYGPIVDLGPLNEAVGGWPTAISGTVVALRDANIDNTRALEQWTAIDQSNSITELEAALGILGVPWVNTIATDRDGNAYYGDVGAFPNVTQEKLDACIDTAIGVLVQGTTGRTVLNGSRSECEWGNDEGAPDGLFGPQSLPRLVSADYTANSNGSYWLSNPDELLEGFSPIMGGERIEQTLRTRQAFVQAEDRIAGADGLGQPGFDVALMQQVMFGNRNLAAELALEDVVTLCNAVPDWSVYSNNPTEAESACSVLGSWDGLFNTDSVGPMLWNEFWRRVDDTNGLWAVEFDPDDPVRTPRELNDQDEGVSEAVRVALGEGVDFMVDQNIPLDRPWGEVQFRLVGDERIPIHGGSGRFMFSVISANLIEDEAGGYFDPRSGNSYIMVAGFNEGPCPDVFAVQTYSQSSNPESPHFADMTRLYSQEGWNDMPFCEADIEATKVSEMVISTDD